MTSERYERQVRLKGFGSAGQQALQEASVLIVGAGGLGIPVAQYLNAMGVGQLGLMDGDVVEESNLHRQTAYGPDSIGCSKVRELARWLRSQNPDTRLEVLDTFLHTTNALEVIRNYDLVVDATDNLTTRYLIDDACLILQKPWIYGALHGFEGQLSVLNYEGGPTYRCLFPNPPGSGEIPDCNTMGTLGVLPGIMGNLQALEAVKLLCGLDGVLKGQLLIYDALAQEMRHITFQRDPRRRPPESLEEPRNTACSTDDGAIVPLVYQKVRDAGQAHILVDVREPSEFRAHHIPHAQNIPLLQLEAAWKRLEAFPEVFLICKSGPRSRQAYQLLTNYLPGKQIRWIQGGMRDYKVENI